MKIQDIKIGNLYQLKQHTELWVENINSGINIFERILTAEESFLILEYSLDRKFLSFYDSFFRVLTSKAEIGWISFDLLHLRNVKQ